MNHRLINFLVEIIEVSQCPSTCLLSVEEKLRIVEALWDDIGASDKPIVLHPWQKDEARRRSAELKSDPSIAIDRDELWRRVDG